jgi:hypothetical protein
MKVIDARLSLKTFIIKRPGKKYAKQAEQHFSFKSKFLRKKQ